MLDLYSALQPGMTESTSAAFSRQQEKRKPAESRDGTEPTGLRLGAGRWVQAEMEMWCAQLPRAARRYSSRANSQMRGESRSATWRDGMERIGGQWGWELAIRSSRWQPRRVIFMSVDS